MSSDHLVLARNWANGAFGFHWSDRSGALGVRHIVKWVQDFAANKVLRPGAPLYSGCQFDSRKQRVGVLFGFILGL